MTLQEPLYQLRSDTKDAFDEAKRLEARWKELEKEQREVYQVRFRSNQCLCGLLIVITAIHPSISINEVEARYNCSGRHIRGVSYELRERAA